MTEEFNKIVNTNNIETTEEKNKKLEQDIKEEIKGFPELSESVYNLYDQDKTRIRFSNNRSILRALMDPSKVDDLRVLLSIVNLNKVDYYKQLLEIKYFRNGDFEFCNGGAKAEQIYKHINCTLDKKNEFPSIQWLVNELGLPYSREFFDEYLLNEEDLIYEINIRINKYIEAGYKQLSKELDGYSGDTMPIRQRLDSINKKYKLINIADNINDKFDSLSEYISQKKDEVLLSTGIKELDDRNVKLSKGKISTVFAYTGSYKTMFCTNVAYNIIKNKGNILYVSLEICKEEMYINFLSRHSNEFGIKISHSEIKNNEISEEDKKYLFDAIYPDFKQRYKEHLIVYDETDIGNNTYSKFNKLFSNADEMFIKNTGHGIDLIVIDHLNLLKFGNDNKAQNDYSVVNHWMSYFRKNCINFLNKDKQVGFLCACQSSRDGYKKAIKPGKYNLTSIAEGNEIERSSQYVLSILTLDDDRQNNKTRMQILKSRDSASDDSIINIYLEPKYYLFGVEMKNKPKKDDKYSNIKNSSIMVNVFNSGNSSYQTKIKEVVVNE